MGVSLETVLFTTAFVMCTDTIFLRAI